MQNHRLAQQIQFIVEIDKLKRILRQTLLTDGSLTEGAPALWSFVESVIEDYVKAGYFKPEPELELVEFHCS